MLQPDETYSGKTIASKNNRIFDFFKPGKDFYA